jgi:hypothetical protein
MNRQEPPSVLVAEWRGLANTKSWCPHDPTYEGTLILPTQAWGNKLRKNALWNTSRERSIGRQGRRLEDIVKIYLKEEKYENMDCPY